MARKPPVPAPRRKFTPAHINHGGGSLVNLVRMLDENEANALADNQKSLFELKKNIAVQSKKNFQLEKEVRNLDKKIALLIKNRISLEEVMAQSGDLQLLNRTTTLKNKKEKERYGELFYLLQMDTKYIAQLAQLVTLGQIDNLLQTVMFTLYGNQYDESEEHLLLSMFKTVLAAEFENAKSISGILRANTAITRMMTTYTRRSPGQQYLKTTLSKILKNLVDQKELQLEINPLKVYDFMINEYETTTGKLTTLPRKPDQEEAAANPDVQKLIAPRLHKLGEIVDNTISVLIASIDTVPYGIRWICKQIFTLAKKHFAGGTKAQFYSMIGGFFLLRFVNPAIVTPQAFMIIDAKISNSTRRNLTLLAKIMQNLANNVQFGGVKEAFMAPLNEVLDRNRVRVNEFLEALCNVDELDEHLQLDKYLALAKTQETSINISLNEMYFIHSLLCEHLTSVTQIEGHHEALKKIINALGPAPPQLPRKENANVELSLKKLYDDTNQVDEQGNEDEQLYAETKYLLFMVCKAVPEVHRRFQVIGLMQLLSEIDRHAKKQKNANILDGICRIKANCKTLVERGIIEQDKFDKLRDDVIHELENYEDLVEKTKKDVTRLQNVIGTIEDHYSFLEAQLEAYKQYLGNVRQNCNRKDKKKEKKEAKKKAKRAQRKGPFKYSHSQLEKDGIIIESEVPDDRRTSIYFSFSSSSPGIFDVTVLYKGRNISKMQLKLDDLLELQHMNQLEYETDFLKLNVNLLIYLLNKDFVS